MLFRIVARFACIRIENSSWNRFTSTAYFVKPGTFRGGILRSPFFRSEILHKETEFSFLLNHTQAENCASTWNLERLWTSELSTNLFVEMTCLVHIWYYLYILQRTHNISVLSVLNKINRQFLLRSIYTINTYLKINFVYTNKISPATEFL